MQGSSIHPESFFNMPATAIRLAAFTESVIRGTTQLANQYGAINHLIRFHFAKNEETLRAAGQRLLAVSERR